MPLYWLFLFLVPLLWAQPSDYFVIQIIDAQSKRGVPLVELKTVNEIRYYSDSNGIIAFDEPGLMNQEVFFHIHSHGYRFPKDGFGYRGKKLLVQQGEEIQIELERVNIAERLYRITGQGIYRDSVLVGKPVPLKQPVLNAQVMGQDTVMATEYQNKLWWFWGDTNRASYPLGNFAVSGATSLLPSQGGLPPQQGINLHYLTNQDGFSKKMCPIKGPGVVWIEGLIKVTDPQGKERLLAQYERRENLETVRERGLAVFDHKKQQFVKLQEFATNHPLYPRGHPINITQNGKEYLYFAHPHPSPFPNVRVEATWQKILDQTSYQTFTCYPAHSIGTTHPKVERTPKGQIVYAWKPQAIPINSQKQQQLLQQQTITPTERWLPLTDIQTGNPLHIHAGSVFWNPFRQRWIAIAQQVGGRPSFLGELWFAEADTPIGPWAYARKIITHNNYTFYNPTQHPFFDQQQGRLIYFEGTYTNTFTAQKVTPPTPRYNYNQIMYRLDLAEPRLSLPCPLYHVGKNKLAWGKHGKSKKIAFFALPPGRELPETIPIYRKLEEGFRLQKEAEGGEVLFYAYSQAQARQKPKTVALYEYHHSSLGYRYSTQAKLDLLGWQRGEKAFCYVWENPFGEWFHERNFTQWK